MGLDSIELLIRFEKEFKKDVSDQEAENIHTVGDMANWFYQKLTIHEPNKERENNKVPKKDYFIKKYAISSPC